ncbi:uncharacterized protein PSFLO_06560 [Pseudozyma flocculosa]|nr:uncharacterized protein PSFLO_06560 [Pseudozyma flocculosa]
MARISSNLSRRNKSLKQILQSEREAALRAAGIAAGTKARGAPKKTVAPGEIVVPAAAAGAGAGAGRMSETAKSKLTGAAKKAYARREERERLQRIAAAEAAEAEAAERKEEEDDAAAAAAADKMQVDALETKADEVASGADAKKDEDDVKPPAAEAEAIAAPGGETKEGEEDEEAKTPRPKRDVPTYATVEAPPSLRPQKKYCDVTGLIAPYTDPKSRLRYHSVEVYEIIKQFGPGVDNAYLSLRGDATEIK